MFPLGPKKKDGGIKKIISISLNLYPEVTRGVKSTIRKPYIFYSHFTFIAKLIWSLFLKSDG